MPGKTPHSRFVGKYTEVLDLPRPQSTAQGRFLVTDLERRHVDISIERRLNIKWLEGYHAIPHFSARQEVRENYFYD